MGPAAAAPRAALFLLAVILMPGALALAGIMAALVLAVGMPPSAAAAVGLAAGGLSALPSCFLLALSVYMIFKCVLLGRPLLNRQRWRRRLRLDTNTN